MAWLLVGMLAIVCAELLVELHRADRRFTEAEQRLDALVSEAVMRTLEKQSLDAVCARQRQEIERLRDAQRGPSRGVQAWTAIGSGQVH